jgi:hypothetical protein
MTRLRRLTAIGARDLDCLFHVSRVFPVSTKLPCPAAVNAVHSQLRVRFRIRLLQSKFAPRFARLMEEIFARA